MALPQEARATFRSLVESGNIRYIVTPVGAPLALISDNAAGAWDWAAYVQILAAAPADPCWLCGVFYHTAAVATHHGDMAIAAAAVDLAIIPYEIVLVGATGNTLRMAHVAAEWLPFPVRIAGAPVLNGRIRKNTAANLDGVSLKVILATGIGT